MRARDNPFSTDRVLQVRYRLPAGVSWPGLLERLEQMSYRAALVGPEGSGKTTLLERLAPHLPRAARWVRLSRNERRLPAALLAEPTDAGRILLVDGAEQLAPWNWWRLKRLARKASGLIITSHRPGLLPTLIECRTSPELLQELVEELTGRQLPETQLTRLFQQHRGNVREALRELYDRCASDEWPATTR